MNKEKKFRFYAPAEIVKAKSPNGDTIMRLGGIASTTKEDSDGETLIPSGFDLTILKSEGFINWSHMKTPDAVIGEPYKAEIRKDGFYLEADLYNESAIAKSAYKLAQVLSKNSKNRKLGWSIEGTATERDPLNDKIVKKAKITGVALCLMPKNPGTFADIIKGEFDYLNDDELKKSEESTFELETINKALNSELIKAKILLADNLLKAEIGEEDDEEKKDGKTKKALSTGSSSGKAVARAHVDGDLKDQKMVKSLIMEKVFDMFPDIELNKAKNICKIILKVSDMNQKIKVPTEDEISKAMEVLGITKEEEYTEDSLVKAKSELDSLLEKETPQEELQKAFDLVSDIKEALKKGKAKDAEAEDEAEDEDEEDEGGEKDDLSKKMKMKKAKTEEKEDKEEAVYMKKAKTNDDDTEDKFEKYLKKANGEIEKADDKEYVKDESKGGYKEANGGKTSTPELQKSLEDGLNKLSAKQDEMSKAIGTVLLSNQKESEEFQKDLLSRLESLENSTPGRKTALTKGIADKQFGEAPLDTLEKAGAPKIDANAISVSRDKVLVGNIIEKAMYAPLEKGGSIDPTFEKALTVWEVSKSVDKVTRLALRQQHNINLVD